jgi:hypothetical protein
MKKRTRYPYLKRTARCSLSQGIVGQSAAPSEFSGGSSVRRDFFLFAEREEFIRLDEYRYEPCALSFVLGIRLPLIEIGRERLPVFEDFPHK